MCEDAGKRQVVVSEGFNQPQRESRNKPENSNTKEQRSIEEKSDCEQKIIQITQP